MNIGKKYIEREIYLEDSYSNDDPLPRYGRLTLRIDATKVLDEEADRIRIAKGYKPFFTYDGKYDADGWYDYFIVIAKNVKGILYCEGLYCEVINTDEEDAYTNFKINLSDNQLNWFCERVCNQFGQNRVEELLA